MHEITAVLPLHATTKNIAVLLLPLRQYCNGANAVTILLRNRAQFDFYFKETCLKHWNLQALFFIAIFLLLLILMQKKDIYRRSHLCQRRGGDKQKWKNRPPGRTPTLIHFMVVPLDIYSTGMEILSWAYKLQVNNDIYGLYQFFC